MCSSNLYAPESPYTDERLHILGIYTVLDMFTLRDYVGHNLESEPWVCEVHKFGPVLSAFPKYTFIIPIQYKRH